MAAPIDQVSSVRFQEVKTDDSPTTQHPEMCNLCVKKSARYTCPRCNVRYCSLECYRSEKHGGCSEAFYHDCVVEDLADTAVSPDDHKHVMEILERQKDVAEEEEEELNDLEDDIDLEDRLQGLDLDSDSLEVWNRLTEKERNEFNQMLEDGRLANLVKVWIPWWCVENKEMVLEVDEAEKLLPGQPPIIEDIPDINKLLTKSHPSSNLRYNMVNVLYSYAFVSRLHNGGHLDCPTDAVQDLLMLCSVLDQPVVCASVGEAIQMCLNIVQESPTRWSVRSEFMLNVIDDVKKIVSGPHNICPLNFMLSALSDIVQLLKTALTTVHTDSKCSSSKYKFDRKTLKKRIFHADKKCRFLLSWCQRYGMAVPELVPEITLEMKMRLADVKEVNKTKQQLEEQWGDVKPKPKSQLIQEIG